MSLNCHHLKNLWKTVIVEIIGCKRNLTRERRNLYMYRKFSTLEIHCYLDQSGYCYDESMKSYSSTSLDCLILVTNDPSNAHTMHMQEES